MEKVALVTGAGSGVGRAVAVALAGAQWSVVLAGRRLEKLAETARLASGSPGRIVSVATDVGDPKSVESLFKRVRAEFGRLDLLFNNAGANSPAVPIEDLPVDDWMKVVSVNLTGVFLCAREAFRLMKEQIPKGGRIINNGSISAHVPRPNSAPYTATKHGVTGLTKSLALDGRAHRIACGQIDIGNAATEMTERMTVGVLQPDGSLKVEPRIDVAHVAAAVLYMASLPLEANVQWLTVMATQMPFMGRG